MPNSKELMKLARRGAEARYDELRSELAALVKAFPHLRTRKRTGLSGLADKAVATVRKRRKRKTMSAKARKAVSQRMKKYWAQRRKAKRA